MKPALSRKVVTVVGVLSVLSAVAAGHLVSGITDPDASPVLAVGNAVRDLSPPAVTEFAISNLGDAKKPLLFTGIAVALLVVGATAGLLSRRRLWPGLTTAAVVGLTGLLAVLVQPAVDPLGVLAPLTSLATGMTVFGWLHILAARSTPEPPSQRGFLASSAGTGVGSAAESASRRGFLASSAGTGGSATGSSSRRGFLASSAGTGARSAAESPSRRGSQTPSAGTDAHSAPELPSRRGSRASSDGSGVPSAPEAVTDHGLVVSPGGSGTRLVPESASDHGFVVSSDGSDARSAPEATPRDGLVVPSVEAGTRSPSRRGFLITSAGVAAGAAALGGGGQLLAARTGVEASRAAVGPIVPTVPPPPIPAGADFAEDGTPTFLTPNRDFYRVDTALTRIPAVRAEDWRLHLHGMVDRERTYTYDEIRSRPLVASTITMTCVSNEVGGPYVSTATFVGVPLRDLLTEAGIRPGADQLFSTSVDGWTAGTPVDAVLDTRRGALLAIGMNGEPLPLEHGFPARLVVPGLYGFVSATKWVTDLELTTFAEREAYWARRGWARRAPIKTQSRIETPRGFATVPAGRVVIAGVAWAQHVGVHRVEVRVDGGPWRPATLATEVNAQTWRMWRTEVTLAAGQHRAEVRATDRRGRTQPADRVPPIPDGASGWHSVQFTAV